jgi:hypothetical protein
MITATTLHICNNNTHTDLLSTPEMTSTGGEIIAKALENIKIVLTLLL